VFNVGSVQGYLKLNTTGWTTGMARASASVQNLGRTFARMGAVAVGSILLLEREFGKFDKAIRHATSVSETSSEEFKRMSEMALDASVKWNMAASNTAQAFYYLGSAGLTVTEQIQAFNSTIMLSRAMGSELSMTVEGMVDIVRAFGLEFSNVEEIADQLTKTVITSNQVFRDLDQALSYGAASARQANNTLAETAAMLGVMANAGIKGSMAGTVLRRAMTNLMSPTAAMTGLMAELNMNVYDAGGIMKPFIQIMGELSDKLKGASDTYKNMVFEVLFGRRAISGQIMLFNYGASALRKYANEIQNAGGTTERVAGKQMKAFTEVLGQLWREMQRAAIELGGTLAPAFERLANGIRDRLGVFRGYIEVNSAAIAETLKWAAAISALLAIGTPLLLLVTTLATQMVMLASVIASPFVALIAALYVFRALWTETTDEMKRKAWETAESVAESFTSRIVNWMAKSLPSYAQGDFLEGARRYRESRRDTGGRLGQFAQPDLKMQLPIGQFAQPDLKMQLPIEKATSAFDEIWTTTIESVSSRLKKDMAGALDFVTESLKDTHPALATLIEKIEAAYNNLKKMIDLFMIEPDPFWRIMLDNLDEANKKLRANAAEWHNVNDAGKAAGKSISKMAQGWSTAMITMFRPAKGTETTWGRAFTTTLTDIQSAWSSTVDTVITEGGNMQDFLENMFLGILRAFQKMASELLASELLYQIFGRGETRGTGAWRVSDMLGRTFLENPLTVPERVTDFARTNLGGQFGTPINAQKMAPNITINNNTGTEFVAEKPTFNGEDYVVNIVTKKYKSDPNFRYMFRG